MQIVNESKKTVIAEDYISCETVASKARGLMFHKKAYLDEHALIFIFDRLQYHGLHMFFVFYPINLLFLDENFKVVEFKKHFRPFTVYNSERKAKYVLEVSDGAIDTSKTDVGDLVSWD
jgi:uncharacterized membrane protein (UPF0127 family)